MVKSVARHSRGRTLGTVVTLFVFVCGRRFKQLEMNSHSVTRSILEAVFNVCGLVEGGRLRQLERVPPVTGTFKTRKLSLSPEITPAVSLSALVVGGRFR